jgi:flagellar basal-body rod protein FlgG
MEARRASYCCGLVLGLAIGVVAAHVAFSSRLQENRSPTFARITGGPSLSETPVKNAPGELFLETEPRKKVVALGDLPAEPLPTSAVAEAPQALPIPEDAAPLAPRAAEDDRDLRDMISHELDGNHADDQDIWYEALRDLPMADATAILRLWKSNRGGGSLELPAKIELPDAEEPPSTKSVDSQHLADVAEPAGPLDEIRQIHLENLANCETIGFKRMEPVDGAVESVMKSDSPTETKRIGAKLVLTPGTLERSDRTFDLAIDGPGFFHVHVDGADAFTRRGSFELDGSRRLSLRLADGRTALLEPELVVPADCRSVVFRTDGEVAVRLANAEEEKTLGTISLSLFLDASRLESLGDGLYAATAESGTAWTKGPADGETIIRQGWYERSNVVADEEHEALARLQEREKLLLSAEHNPADVKNAPQAAHSLPADSVIR